MEFFFSSKMSRLKKKLLLYFILIAVVSISVSVEIIIELSTSRFRVQIENIYINAIKKEVTVEKAEKIRNHLKEIDAYEPLDQFRNRMILLLLVISGSIFGAFFLFTKDIVSPMDGMVDATKKIASGDLTVTVPVMSEDEIGQMAGLINDMNVNLQDLIMQIRQEVNRHKEKIHEANQKVAQFLKDDITDKIISKKKIKVSEFKRIVDLGHEIDSLLEIMSTDLSALLTFVNMYKTYRSKTQYEISQDEIESAINSYQENDD